MRVPTWAFRKHESYVGECAGDLVKTNVPRWWSFRNRERDRVVVVVIITNQPTAAGSAQWVQTQRLCVCVCGSAWSLKRRAGCKPNNCRCQPATNFSSSSRDFSDWRRTVHSRKQIAMRPTFENISEDE